MGVTNTNKELNVTQIDCGGSFRVQLSLTASPDITTTPADIVLVLNRSRNMAGSPLANLKNGAEALINLLDEGTDGTADGTIGGGSRVAIVSFADTATADTQLITSTAELTAAVNGLTAAGQSNHAAAFQTALGLFEPDSTNQKILVLISDGVNTTGSASDAAAEAAKAEGVTIYAIGLAGSSGVNESALEGFATAPGAAFATVVPADAEVESLFENLANNITRAGATNIVITDTIASCFRVTALSTPTVGTASIVNATTVRWTIDSLGVSASEGAVFEFTAEHIGPCSGAIAVNESITYTDNEGNVVSFPTPTLDVDCGSVICLPSCSEAVEITAEGCTDTVIVDAGTLAPGGVGRIVQMDVTLQRICPNKRVALAALLFEVDADGNEFSRGMKTLTVPAQTGDSCRDVTVRCVTFVLPEDLSVGESGTAVCPTRQFRARFITHYIDTDFSCCECQGQ